jgi:hypothetical protein
VSRYTTKALAQRLAELEAAERPCGPTGHLSDDEAIQEIILNLRYGDEQGIRYCMITYDGKLIGSRTRPYWRGLVARVSVLMRERLLIPLTDAELIALRDGLAAGVVYYAGGLYPTDRDIARDCPAATCWHYGAYDAPPCWCRAHLDMTRLGLNSLVRQLPPEVPQATTADILAIVAELVEEGDE